MGSSLASLLAVLVLFALAPAARAADLAAESIEVEKVDAEKEKHPTMRFLRENRDFLRGQLDLLRQLAKRNQAGDAESLDPRYLLFREMLAAIRAASDTSSAGAEWIRRRDLLASVTEIGELEAQMDRMEETLRAQGERLAQLQEDFVGRQETALVILVRGHPAGGFPAAVVIRDDQGDALRVSFSAEEQASLASGGIAQVYHRFVEPREQTLQVSLEGAAWTAGASDVISIAPERDRLNFLELDLARIEPAESAYRIASRVWTW